MKLQEIADRQDRIIKDVLAGAKIRDVADKYNVSRQTVYRLCHIKGVVLPPGPERRKGWPGLYPILADLINTTATLTDIGVKHNISVSRVCNIHVKAEKAGIKMPKRPGGRPKSHSNGDGK